MQVPFRRESERDGQRNSLNVSSILVSKNFLFVGIWLSIMRQQIIHSRSYEFFHRRSNVCSWVHDRWKYTNLLQSSIFRPMLIVRSIRNEKQMLKLYCIYSYCYFSILNGLPTWLAISLDHITLFSAVLNKAADVKPVQVREFRSQDISLHLAVLWHSIFSCRMSL